MPGVAVNAIEVIIFLFLSLSTPCNALPAQTTDVGNRNYIVLPYTCGEKMFFVWHLECTNRPGESMMSRPFYIHELGTGYGLYVNKLGEVVTGFNPSLDKMLIYNCGI